MLLSQSLLVNPTSISLSIGQQKEQIIQTLKVFLHQNNLSLYCSQNEDKQTLLDALADNLSLKRQQLHKTLSIEFKRMLSEQNLPKRLIYIYSDPQIVSEYERDPELVCFYKITYQLVCTVYEVKLVIYTLVQRSDKSYLLNAMIVNPKGSQRQILIARINNTFYRVQQQFHQLIDQYSITSLHSYPSAKSSNNLNSEQKQQKQFTKMMEPFKSEQIIVTVIANGQDQIDAKIKYTSQNCVAMSTGESVGGNGGGGGITVKDTAHHSSTTKLIIPSNRPQQSDHQLTNHPSIVSEYGDDVSLGSILDKQQQKDLLNKCSNIINKEQQQLLNNNNSTNQRNLVHTNNHVQNTTTTTTTKGNYSQDMMYYYYIQHQNNFATQGAGYPGKSQPYLPYAGHPISPSKNHSKLIQINATNSPVKPTHPFSTLYTTHQAIPSPQPIMTPQSTVQPTLPPLQIKQGQRYKGRLKFFDQGKNYGFIIMDADQSDLFVHFDDLQKAGITKQKLKTYKQNQGYMQVKFTFKVMEYFGKYRQSRKAVELEVMEAP